MPIATSRTVDPIARAAAGLYAFGVLVWLGALIPSIATRSWGYVAAIGVLVLLFSIQAWGWSHAAVCRITVDPEAAHRDGPLGWRVELGDIASWDLVERRGRTYLAVVPRSLRQRLGMSGALLGSSMPRGSVVGPLAPEAVPAFRDALSELTGRS